MRELELFLLEFYAIGDKRYTFENCYFDWIEYKKIFSSSNNDKKKLSPSTIRRMQRDYDTYIKGTPLASHSIRTLTPTIIGNKHSGHDVGCAVYRRGDEANIFRTSIHGIRRTYSSMLQASGYSRLMVSTLLGHTPRTNEDHYSYDVTSITAKKQVIEAMSSNVIKFTA